MAQDGTRRAAQLTTGADTYKYEIHWSPDGKKILWTDKMLSGCTSSTSRPRRSRRSRPRPRPARSSQFAWSPDSRWIAYGQARSRGPDPGLSLFPRLQEDLAGDRRLVRLRRDPAFSADGKYLFFVSDRDFNPDLQPDRVEPRLPGAMSRIYFVTLAKDTKSPFEPKSDEVAVKPRSRRSRKPRPRRQAGRRQADGRQARRGGARQSRSRSTRTASWTRIVALPIETCQLRRTSPSSGTPSITSAQGHRERQPISQCSTIWPSTRRTDLGQGRAATRSRPTGRRCSSPRTAPTPSSTCPKAADQVRGQARPLRDGDDARPQARSGTRSSRSAGGR